MRDAKVPCRPSDWSSNFENNPRRPSDGVSIFEDNPCRPSDWASFSENNPRRLSDWASFSENTLADPLMGYLILKTPLCKRAWIKV